LFSETNVPDFSGLTSFVSLAGQSSRNLGHRLIRLATQPSASRRLIDGGLAALAVACLMAGYHLTGVPVTLIIDGQAQHLRTHQDTVAGLLREEDIQLFAEARVVPGRDAQLAAGSVVKVRRSRVVTVEADGRVHTLRTQHQRVSDILAEAGVRVRTRDEVWVDGQLWSLNADLPQAVLEAESRRGPGLASAPSRAAPVRIVLHRAVPVYLSDEGVSVTFYATQATVGEALMAQGMLLYLGDRVTPSLGSRVLPGVRIYIQRSTPVAIQADGRVLRTRTQNDVVGDVLAQEGVLLMGRDYSLPPASSPLVSDMTIQVVRVREVLEIEQELIPFETKWIADPDMLIDTQQVTQMGGEGVIKRRYRVTYEDGQEVANRLEDEWLDHSPSDKIIAYGTKIAVHSLETPDGPFEYWRHFRVLATSYSAATSGKDKDHPRYGVTRTGLTAGYGVVAVDPKVIPLWTEIYVPGYGRAIAGDTGGSILGRHIDLGFNEEVPPLWYRWIDVYLATPVPPADQVRYLLPNWPQEPR
jgi:uncharacterized protein YabE (DUF348 family)